MDTHKKHLSKVFLIITKKISFMEKQEKYVDSPLIWSILAKNCSRHFEIFVPENRLYFMQIVSSEDYLHEMSKPIFLRK